MPGGGGGACAGREDCGGRVSAPWFLLAGIGIGCAETAEHPAIATYAPTDISGSAFGLLAATQSFGNLAASLGAGLLWTAFSPSSAFTYLAIWMASHSHPSPPPCTHRPATRPSHDQAEGSAEAHASHP